MCIKRWNPRQEVSKREENILKRCRKKRKLFSFLRQHRLEIFTDEFQEELAAMYRDTGAGKTPVCPGLLAMASILQGYLGLSDADAVEATVIDLRWQMVLDCIGSEDPAFSQGALFSFRERLIAHDMDRRLLERTAELARLSKGFDAKKLPKTLRVAIDSSPLEGAGRVEDTINLIGHAARNVARCAAQLLEIKYEELCQKAGIPLLLDTSIKKALDRDWSDTKQKAEAVDVLARQVLSLEQWLESNLEEQIKQPPLSDVLVVLHQIMDQDLEPDPEGGGTKIKQGVANERRISVEDGEMRHGRKSKSKRIDGYKRHVAKDMDSHAVIACVATPANRPEYEAVPVLKSDIERQGIRVGQTHIDRGYIASAAISELETEGSLILCKPWKNSNGELYSKEDFNINLKTKTVTCPAGCSEKFEYGKTVHFNPVACDKCAVRVNCTKAAVGQGRTVSILGDERRQKKMRQLIKTRKGRQQFRERVSVEHTLAHIGQRQGQKARYLGTRKNTFDLRRAAAIQNLEIVHRNAA